MTKIDGTCPRQARLDEAATIGGLVHDFVWRYAPSHLTQSANTLKGYRTALELYMRYLTGQGVTPETLCADDLCRARIEGCLDWLARERGSSPADLQPAALRHPGVLQVRLRARADHGPPPRRGRLG